MIERCINSHRVKKDKLYLSVYDVSTKDEVKEVVKDLKSQDIKPIFQKHRHKEGFRIFIRIDINVENNEREFLKESNAIEKEHSEIGLIDSILTFEFAKRIDGDLTTEYIMKIHAILMRRLNKRIAGNWRRCAVRVGNDYYDKENKYLLKKKVQDWLIDCEFTKLGKEEDIRRWHISFEKIHPFEDGNGRVGRIIMNVQRLKANLPLLIIHTGKEQQDYYKWFSEKYTTYPCKKCGEITNSVYCKSCYDIAICKACGRRSYGKDYCLNCLRGIGRKR